MAYLTENELIERYKFYASELEDQLVRGDDFHTLTDALPFSVHLNSSDNLELMQTNRAYTQQVGCSIEEISELGNEFLQKRVHPQSLALYPKFLEDSKKSPSSIYIFVHRILIVSPRPDYTPVITFTKPTRLPNRTALCLSPLPHNFGSMINKINRVVEINEFKLKHFGRFQSLTAREVEILRLLSNGYNNLEIGNKLHISRHTVETYRKRIKAKLEIRSFRDLMRYALAFDIANY